MNTKRIKLTLAATLMAVTVGSAVLDDAAHAQSTVGDWDLSPWQYTGQNISTTTLNSDGSTPVGLSATANSGVTFFLVGESDGTVNSTLPLFIPSAAVSSYQLVQNFLPDAAVDFGVPSSQSQFVDTITDNGVGIRIENDSAKIISNYDLTISLAGGGVFSAVGGDYDGFFGNLAGLGTSTITLEWLPDASTDGVASFDGIQISGSITGFSVTHAVTYFNIGIVPLDLINIVEIKINTAPEPTVGLPGDYNQDGTVDAADYTVWRDNLGSITSLPNDDTPGVGQDDYTRWKANFGVTAGPAGGANAPVPEPSSLALLALALPLVACRLRSTRATPSAS